MRAQTGLEYLLIFGGGILLATITILFLRDTASDAGVSSNFTIENIRDISVTPVDFGFTEADDWGRSGISANLYEGSVKLSQKYVNFSQPSCQSGKFATGFDASGNLQCATATVGSVAWSQLTGFPSACAGGQFVTGVGSSLSCATPSGGVSGSGVANNLSKWTGASSLGSSMLFDNGASVGVGLQPSASYTLDVKGKANAEQLCISGTCKSSWPAGGGGTTLIAYCKVRGTNLGGPGDCSTTCPAGYVVSGCSMQGGGSCYPEPNVDGGEWNFFAPGSAYYYNRCHGSRGDPNGDWSKCHAICKPI